MFCTNCGSQFEDGNSFCPNCGTKVESVAQPVAPLLLPHRHPHLLPRQSLFSPLALRFSLLQLPFSLFMLQLHLLLTLQLAQNQARALSLWVSSLLLAAAHTISHLSESSSVLSDFPRQRNLLKKLVSSMVRQRSVSISL